MKMKQTCRQQLVRYVALMCLTGSSLALHGQTMETDSEASEPDIEEEEIALSQFTVTAEKKGGYSTTNAIGVTRTNMPLIEIPQAISVVNREFLDDTGAAELYDALKYLSGISYPSNVGDTVMIRGFLVRSQYTDGLPDIQTQSQMGAEPFLFERVEVIKGPSAIVYGSHNPGGVLNRVRKTPQWESGGSVGLTAGNHDQYKVEFDATGPIGDQLAYRAVATYRDENLTTGGAPVRFAFLRRWTAAPMLTWRPVEKVQVRFLAELMHEEHFKHWGENALFRPFVPGGPTTIGLLPRDFTFSDVQGRNDNDKQLVWLSLETELTDFWAMRLASTAIWWDHFVVDILPAGFNLDNQTMPRTWRTIGNDDFTVVNAMDHTFNFELGPTKHDVLLISQAGYIRRYSNRVTDRNRPVLDIFNPVYGYQGPMDPILSSDTTTHSESWSISAQDHVRFFEDRLQVVGGIRYDWYRTQTDNNITGIQGEDNRGNATTYKLGVIYKPTSDLSFYYNYAETFNPVFGANPDGSTYDPEEGVINEIGIKTALGDGRITATLSVFDLENRNMLRPDPDPTRASAGWRFQDLKTTTEGVELDLLLAATDNWELMAGVSFLDFDRPDGTIPESASKESASLWTRYSFDQGSLDGLAVGGGLIWKGRAPLEDSNMVFQDAYYTVDLFAHYHWRDYRFSLNISNLLDKEYLNRGVNQNILYYAAPRLVKFRVRYSF
ncbi:MAG: TonB-dependent siderophore receptor [Opitutaceae bacterium]